MVRRYEERYQGSATELLNFHFSSVPQESSSSGRRSQQPPSRRSLQDRASARRKASAAMFPLHSSPDHAFWITRRVPAVRQQQNQRQQYSFPGLDQPVSWASVLLVQVRLSSSSTSAAATTPEEPTCPICLDTFVAPRITKCGHCFCLPCILHHVQAAQVRNPYLAPKCPCCGLEMHATDWRPCQFVSTAPPHRKMKMIKLHRHKQCAAPYLPLPPHPRRSAPHAAPTAHDADALYSQFQYVDADAYMTHLLQNLQDLETFDVTGGEDATCHQAALQLVRKDLETAAHHADEEAQLTARFADPAAGIYQPQNPNLIAKKSVAGAASRQPASILGDSECGATQKEQSHVSFEASAVSESSPAAAAAAAPMGRYRGDSIGSEVSWQSSTITSEGGRPRGDSIASSEHSESGNQKKSPRKKNGSAHHLQNAGGTMFADKDEIVFYQAQDGSLCFLCGFNMNCLKTEYTASLPDDDHETTKANQNDVTSLRPLPDVVEGTVLELERVNVTPPIRQRYRFLGHVPLYTDILFVELNLGSLLSAETKRTHKKEFQRRQLVRTNKLQEEKRQDERAKKKEEERIEELKARMQRIDPNDAFFRVMPEEPPVSFSGQDFGPAIATSRSTSSGRSEQQQHHPSVGPSFSRVASTGSTLSTEIDFPALGAFPSLGSSATTTSTAAHPNTNAPTAWRPSKPTGMGETAAGTTTTTTKPKLSPSQPAPGKKRSKAKKVVLFSTGGQRGGY